MHKAFARCARAALFGAAVGSAPVAAQQSSSWSASTEGIAPSQPKKVGSQLLRKDPAPVKRGPITAPTFTGEAASRFRPPGKEPALPNAGLLGTVIPKINTGNDPAYDAFEQGRYIAAHDIAVEADRRNEPQAATLLGRLYQEGLGVRPDPVTAARWFRRAAELGDIEGTFAFAVMLAEGDGIARNRQGAAQLFEVAAQKGHVLANYNLALLYLRGDGKPESPARAALHLRYAAESGIAQAQYDLATLYATGVGSGDSQSILANATEAATWLERAAEQGMADAELDFGIALFLGRGVEPSQSRGLLYLKSAAEKGNAAAQVRVARCFALGLGTEIDLVEAAKWQAIAQRQSTVDEGLDKALAKLSRADRARAQALAAEWIDKQAVQ